MKKCLYLQNIKIVYWNDSILTNKDEILTKTPTTKEEFIGVDIMEINGIGVIQMLGFMQGDILLL